MIIKYPKSMMEGSVYKELNADPTIKQFFHPDYLGNCMEYVREWLKYNEANFHPFSIAYVQYAKNVAKGLKTTSDEILAHYEGKYDLPTIKDYVWTRAVIQTWNGVFYENKIRLIIEKEQGLRVMYSTERIDYKYAVDLMAYNQEGKLMFGVQVKPNSFKIGNNPSLNRDKEKISKMHNMFKLDFEADVYFAYYTNSGEIFSPIIGKENESKTSH